ncbi:tetratricopeptide repeat protein [Corallococcus exiguus]|nr:tetratricopeptide repeat protein [Corallococcus exiguus]
MRQAHVVILTAITLEYQEALKVEDGAWEGSRWEEEKGPNELPVAFRNFRGKGGKPLRVVVAQAGDMGGVAAANALLPLVEAYRPRCVAMSGVCAGHPRKTNLGDVIAPERLFFHDTGKREPDGVKQDLKTYNLPDAWKVALEHFDFKTRFQNQEWWTKRPIPYEWQENWVLAMLHQGVSDPASHPDCEASCPQWEKVIELLWKSRDVERGTLTLTEKGRKRIGAVLIKHRNQLPDLSPTGTMLPFKVHVAPMGSGNQVVEDEDIWDLITESMRKTLGLEMEAAAIGAVAHAQSDKHLKALVMKGVMDFANQGRDDHFKQFAARASAECLLAFLREQLDVELIPGVDDLLIPGTKERLPEDPPPSALLNARYAVVPFHERGREKVLAELNRWSREGPPVAARLVHGEGGIGKTRLAIEWMSRLSEEWVVGFLPKDVPENWFERLWALGRRVMVVIDYAESRADLSALLMRVLRYAQQQDSGAHRPIRLLLLARSAGDWWQSLLQSDATLKQWLGTPYELTPLATQVPERELVFHEAAERFAKERGKSYRRRDNPSLTDGRFERVLYLHMAALAEVEGSEFEAHSLMDVVLDHEERFWESRARMDDVKLSFHRSLARQVVAAATLRGGFADQDTAVHTAQALFGGTLSEGSMLLLWLLHRIYQRTGAGSSTFLPPLEPDLLGEGMVLRTASPDQGEACPPPDWIDRVFPANESTGAVGIGFQLLGRASAARPDVVRPWIERLLSASLHQRALLALQAAKAVGLHTAFSVLGDALAEQLEALGNERLALKLESAGIPYQTVSLRRVAEWVDRKRLGGLGVSAQEDTLAERARRQNNLSNRLSDMGQRAEALKAAQEAVALHRILAQSNPDAFQPDLSMSLSNLGARLSDMGHREDALNAFQEAVALRRVLAQSNPDAFQPGLAHSLSNLGNGLSDMGQREEALKAAQEAVALHRILAQRNPSAFQPDLAMSLNNLCALLSDMGQRGEALKAAQEAVALYRILTQGNPDAFQPDLAMSLNNLAFMLSSLDQHGEALKAAQEAVALHRILAQRNPGAFQPDLARSINTLVAMLSGMGQREEALKAAQEAVALYRVLAQRNPDSFQPELASSINNLGINLSALDQNEEALKAAQEAVALYRVLAQRNPDAFQPGLARSINNLGDRLSELGQHETALKPYEEALDIIWPFLEQFPLAFEEQAEMMLRDLIRTRQTLHIPLSPVLYARVEKFVLLTGSD